MLKVKIVRLWLTLASICLLMACSSRRPAIEVVQLPAATRVTVVQATEAPAATSTPSETTAPTDTAATTHPATNPATATVTLSATPTATMTPTPTATATPPHPLDIVAMRGRTYPGSELVFEETLDPGSNYERYIVSYLSDGLKIFSYMTVPSGPKPAAGWPIVIFNHGHIPPAQYRSTERYVAYVDAYARRGYIVFRSDYRGHGYSEGVASGGSSSPDYTIDVLNGLASVKRYADADPERIGMWGHSMGGGITLRAMVVRKDVKAGVIWAGMVAPYPDLLTRYLRRLTPTGPSSANATPRPGRHWAQEWLEKYGGLEENASFWTAISANSYLAEISGPVALHHGTADASVPLEYSLVLAEQIEAAGKPVELYTYEGDDHNIAGTWGLAMTRSVDFMDEHVLGMASQ